MSFLLKIHSLDCFARVHSAPGDVCGAGGHRVSWELPNDQQQRPGEASSPPLPPPNSGSPLLPEALRPSLPGNTLAQLFVSLRRFLSHLSPCPHTPSPSPLTAVPRPGFAGDCGALISVSPAALVLCSLSGDREDRQW